ncbi:MAG TPA: alkaline phosphatase, partial [Chthoniobacteraceae bacterium]
LYNDPVSRSGFMNMRSLNSIVTDSSAASSSWGSGSRIMNGAVNMLPDGRWLTPLYTVFAEAGWARGLVTTTEITHATPAGFAANAWTRENPLTIASQYIERKVEVLLGGGAAHFDGGRRSDKRDLKQEFRDAGYAVAMDFQELKAAPVGDRLLGLFAGGHLPFALDHLRDPKLVEKIPTLAAMTRAAIERLARNDRFILQVEGGRVDHGAHNSDAAAALYDQLALDDAIDVCLAFQRENPDTLVVLTSDHGNANFGLNGTGSGYGESSPRFANLRNIMSTFPTILDRLRKRGTSIEAPLIAPDRDDALTPKSSPYKVAEPEKLPRDPVIRSTVEKLASAPTKAVGSGLEVSAQDIAEVIGDATGFKVSVRRAEAFARVLAGHPGALYDNLNTVTAQLGLLMANHHAIGFTSGAHTGDYVPVLAVGPGADRFHGFIENTDVFVHFTDLAGINFRNPTLPLLSEAAPAASGVERIASYADAEVSGQA